MARRTPLRARQAYCTIKNKFPKSARTHSPLDEFSTSTVMALHADSQFSALRSLE
jgi:hypothetical protein